jgi:hypothetical protein
MSATAGKAAPRVTRSLDEIDAATRFRCAVRDIAEATGAPKTKVSNYARIYGVEAARRRFLKQGTLPL